MSFIIATSVPGAYLRYTLDGSAPTPTHGAVITQNVGQLGAILQPSETTHTWLVRVIAYGLYKTPSNVKDFTITLNR